jgi:hypothetical protein
MELNTTQLAGGFALTEGKEENPDLRQKLVKSIVDLATMENLVVLCGLGTSSGKKQGDLGPSMKNLWDLLKTKLDKTFAKLIGVVEFDTKTQGENIESLLSACQTYLRLPSIKTDVKNLIENSIKEAESIIVSKCREFVNDKTDLSAHTNFLRKLARRSSRLPRMKLFTTNYDLCFEEATARTKFRIIDGFGHTLPQVFDGDQFNYDFVRRTSRDRDVELASNVFHFYKLHGSVDWDGADDSKCIRSINPTKPALIYPKDSKYQLSFDQPYFEMMSRFHTALREPNIGLLILGFGFNDRHLSQPILSAVRSNVGMKVMVVSLDCLNAESKNPSVNELRSLVATGDHRITLVQAFFEDFVSVIPDLVKDTEEDQHLHRLEAIRSKL